MSKHETQLTLKYWEQVGGTLIEEFPAVKAGKENSPRWIDAIIIKGGEKRRAKHSEVDLSGKDIIVIQTKTGRVGMYLLGQALFSVKLMEKFNPKSIESVALCQKNDSVLSELLKDYTNLKIVVI